MVQIYCDNNTTHEPWLREFYVEVVHFPYENRNASIKRKVVGSNPTWNQMNMAWAESKFTWNDLNPSEKFPEIRAVLKGSGQNVDTDVQHIDAAYKAGCQIFLTKDKTDILNKRDKLSALLGIKFYHPDEDRAELMDVLDAYRKPSGAMSPNDN